MNTKSIIYKNRPVAKSEPAFQFVVNGSITTEYNKNTKRAKYGASLKFVDESGNEHSRMLMSSGSCSSGAKAYLYAIYNAVKNAKVPCTIRLTGATAAQQKQYARYQAGKAVRDAGAWEAICNLCKEKQVTLELI